MMQASLHGRLVADPVERQTRNGKTMVTARLAVDAAKHGDDPITLWVSVLGFGKQADALLRHGKGDVVAAMGGVNLSKYTGHDGAEREQWTMLADSIMSARTVRHGGRRASAGKRHPAGNRQQPDGDSRPFDDRLPI